MSARWRLGTPLNEESGEGGAQGNNKSVTFMWCLYIFNIPFF